MASVGDGLIRLIRSDKSIIPSSVSLFKPFPLTQMYKRYYKLILLE